MPGPSRSSGPLPGGPASFQVVATGSVVFLFCATAFGVVLTLGGLKYATVETEIYLLTTNLLDLPAASALSLLQLLVVIGLLLASRRLEASGPRRRVELSPLRLRADPTSRHWWLPGWRWRWSRLRS